MSRITYRLLPLLLAAGCASTGGLAAPGGGASVTASGVRTPAALTSLDVPQPEGWADDLALTIPEDLNPDPNILEIRLEAKVTEMEILPGKVTKVWSYGGTLPGPLIRGKVGDRVIVHFTNSLPEATTIHWHGLRVPNGVDGVPGATQEPVASSGTFTYDFTLRDPGTYWYHPHLDSAAQVGWGLYGPIIVDDPADPKEFGDDLVLMLSDMSLEESGEFQPTNAGGAFGDLFGREGSVLLVNGKILPTLKVRQGKQQRWRIINAARSRYYTVSQAPGTLTKVGGDNGLAAYSQQLGRIVLTPGERADVVFTPMASPGNETTLMWFPTERGYGSTFNRPLEKMLTIQTVADSRVEPAAIPRTLRTIERIDTTGAARQHVELTIGATTSNKDGVMMGVNGIEGAHDSHQHPQIEARVGETQVWHVINNTDFAHPFHLHGYFFQVLDDERVPEWKDTVDVPAKSDIYIAVKFDERPGLWMLHCHILDHAELGMMATLRVSP